jgi:tetratricopeptide (TPR) repeat protein
MGMRFKWGICSVIAVLVAGMGAGNLQAQAKKKDEVAKERKPFTIDQVIHPVVAALPAPEFYDPIVSIPMAISSRNNLAQRHVLQGMAYIQAAWDFEAYRHFCAAVQADPDCLMAYWGIGLALAAPNNQFAHERMVAVERMLNLMDATVMAGGREIPLATPMEQKYALALATLFSLRAGEAVKAFRDLSESFPNNLQAKCLAIYLQRDGYDEFGAANFGQELAVEQMEKVVEKNKNNVGVLSFWAMLHAEAPEATTKLREQILPVVRKMARKAPNFPPYQQLLGHFEWRCGNHHLAEVALSRATTLYAAHMKKHKLSFHECDGWIRCQLYLATAMHSRGKFNEAMKIALQLAKVEVDDKRLSSSGANLVIWEARTLPARLYLARGWKGDFEQAISTLPGKNDPQLFKDRTLSIFYLEALRQYLECRRSLQDGDRDTAHKFRVALSETVQRMMGLQNNATRSSSISEYVRAVTALEVYTAEARGLVALAGDRTERMIARDWFKTAAEKQQRPSLLMPPVVVSPMEARLADFFSQTGVLPRAAETYQAALRRRPNDLAVLQGYRQALLQLGRKQAADDIAKTIAAVRKP